MIFKLPGPNVLPIRSEAVGQGIQVGARTVSLAVLCREGN